MDEEVDGRTDFCSEARSGVDEKWLERMG